MWPGDLRFLPIYSALLLICTGYGISFALFAIMVEATGVSGKWVGINAALPALGWIAGALLVPVLQLRLHVEIKLIALVFLGVAILGLTIPATSDGHTALSITRLIFGGALGVFLRCVEYIFAANTTDEERGKFLALYGITFLLGMVVGSAIQPELMFESASLIAIAVFLLAGGVVFNLTKIKTAILDDEAVDLRAFSLFPLAPIAFCAVLAYSLYESIPAYFLQVYALRSGLGEQVAVYTLSAAALGNLILIFPVLALSDRVGRIPVLMICAVVAAFMPLAISASASNTTIFLLLIGILGASAGATYGLSFAMLGDRFSQANLVVANAVFGILYAVGSVVGPLLHGIAMELQGPPGILYSVATVFGLLFLSSFFFQSSTSKRRVT